MNTNNNYLCDILVGIGLVSFVGVWILGIVFLVRLVRDAIKREKGG